MSDRQKGLVLAFVAASISGVSVFLNAFAVREFGDPTLYTTLKNLLAAAILIGVGVAVGGRSPIGRLALPSTSRDRLRLLGVGVIGGGVAFALFFQGLAATSSTSAAFIQKTLVIWVAVLAVAFLRERFGPFHVVAIAALVVGQALASGGVGSFVLDRGGAMVLMATLLWSAEIIIAKPLLRSVSPVTVAAGRMGIGVVVLAAIALVGGSASQLSSVTPQAWLWVLVTGIVLSGYVGIWFAALSRAQAVDVTAVLVFGAVVTALLGAGVRGTSLAPSALGLAFITFGAFAVAWLGSRRERSPVSR